MAIKHNNIFLIGPMGAGKTSIGRYLAERLNLEYYDTDQVVEERTGADLPWIFDIEGEAGFRRREARIVDELTQLSGVVIATGGGAILLPENRQHLSSRGTVIYLRVSLDLQLSRTRRTQRRPLLLGQAEPKEVLEQLRIKRQPLYEEIADFAYDTDGRSVDSIGQEIVENLQKA